MPSRTRDSLLARALLDAQLRYDPQLGALRGLRSQRAQEYTQGRRVAASNSRAITAAVDEVRPDVAGAFDQALASAAAQRGALGVDAAEPQAAAYRRRVGEQKANALRDLLVQKQQAQAGRIYANQSARSSYLADKGKIDDQILGLVGEAGAYAASRRGDLADQAAGRALTARGQTLAHRRGVEANRIARGKAQREAAKARKAKLRPPGDHEKAKSQVDAAQQWIANLGQNMSSTEVRALLATGGEVENVKGEVLKVPQVPKTYINVAYDLRDRGGLSKPNITALHQLGYSIKTLGYSTKAGKNMATKRALSDLAKKRRAGGRLKPVR